MQRARSRAPVRQAEFGGRTRRRRRLRRWSRARAPNSWQRQRHMLHGAPAAVEQPGRGATRAHLPLWHRPEPAAHRCQQLNVPVQIVDNLNAADAVMTLKNYYRQQPAPIMEAERRNVPVYILRSNTVTQMEQCLVDIFQFPPPGGCLRRGDARDAGRHPARAQRRLRRRRTQPAVGRPSAASSINWRAPPTWSATAMGASHIGACASSVSEG
jgi:hypothetical protein